MFRPAVLSLALAACAASPHVLAAPPAATPSATNWDGSCTATLSGAVSGTVACSVSARPEGGLVHITLVATEALPGVTGLGPVAVDVPSPLRTATYTLSDGATGKAALELATGRYVASPTEGQVTLTIDQAEREAKAGYVVSGSLAARLVPARDSRAKGEVRIDARF